jgi:hypothetical protein
MTEPRRTPLWRLLAVAAAAAALVPATGPVKDVDAYWHVRLGDLILRTTSIPTREPWSFASLGRRWVPHSWLSDAVLALAHRAGGWGGVAALRLLLGAALLALVARATIRGTDAVGGPVVFAVAAVALAPFVLDRPQLFALVLAAAVLPRLGTWAPHPIAAAALGWLWASLHGSWPLLPGALVLAGACAAMERRAWRRYVLGAALAMAGAAATPVGPVLLTRPFAVAREARVLLEWQPTRLWSPDAAAFGVLLAVLALAWALGPRQRAAALLWCGAFAGLGLSAGRNVSFAVVAIAPYAARAVSAALPEGRRSTVPAWTVPASAATAALLLAALVAGSPRLPADRPRALVATLRAQPGELRVLNDYAIGGYLTGEEVPAAIDGRIDAFPPGFLARYRAAMRLEGDWSGLLAELRPTHALLDRTDALAHVLEHERGWRRLGADRLYVLLAAP